jgi:hypothetical protein
VDFEDPSAQAVWRCDSTAVARDTSGPKALCRTGDAPPAGINKQHCTIGKNLRKARISAFGRIAGLVSGLPPWKHSSMICDLSIGNPLKTNPNTLCQIVSSCYITLKCLQENIEREEYLRYV